MHGRAHRKIVCPTQKQNRDTHGERKGMGILFKEERGTSDTRQAGRQTHTHTHAHTHARVQSQEERSMEVAWISRIGRSFRCLFTFGQLPCFLPHTWLVHDPPQDACATVCWLGSYHRAWRVRACASFLTLRKPSCAWADRDVFLDLRSGHRISLL